MRLNKSQIRILVGLFYVIGITVQMLVLSKMIPFNWVNGGMSNSYEVQAFQSSVSIVILSILFVFVTKITKQPENSFHKQKILYVIVLILILGMIMQLFGTAFERYFLSLVLLLGIVAHSLLIILIYTSKNLKPNH